MQDQTYIVAFIFAGCAWAGLFILGLVLYLSVMAIFTPKPKPTDFTAQSEWRETMKCWDGEDK